MELDVFHVDVLRSGCVAMHVKNVHSVFSIGRVAKDLGEDEDWPWDVANGMDLEDGVIWVYGIGDDGVMAFTDLGIENLIELIRIQKQNPELLKRGNRSSIVRSSDRYIAVERYTYSRVTGDNGKQTVHWHGVFPAFSQLGWSRIYASATRRNADDFLKSQCRARNIFAGLRG
ncbi:hypothetical protein [Bradyrhizobium sp. 139]|uniref:hypothetical protein n=1 Tax=Bradyrhizobium sp. 139 TaxID=2782616 RepID=UPI0031FEECCA